MATKEQVKKILEGLDVQDPKVDILEGFGSKILAGVISPSYEGMDQGKRQAMVWGKLLDEIGDDAARWVEFVYTDSPGEIAAKQAVAEAQATPRAIPDLEAEVRVVLEGLNLANAEIRFLDNSGTQSLVSIISPAFESMEHGVRQALVQKALGDQLLRQIEFVYTDTPEEAAEAIAEARR